MSSKSSKYSALTKVFTKAIKIAGIPRHADRFYNVYEKMGYSQELSEFQLHGTMMKCLLSFLTIKYSTVNCQ